MGVTKTFSLLYSPFKFRIYTSKAIPYKNFGGEAAQKIEAEKLNPDRQAGSLTWLTWLTEWVDLIWLSQLSVCLSDLSQVLQENGKKGEMEVLRGGKKRTFLFPTQIALKGKFLFHYFPLWCFDLGEWKKLSVKLCYVHYGIYISFWQRFSGPGFCWVSGKKFFWQSKEK